jgi:hypothetical protein
MNELYADAVGRMLHTSHTFHCFLMVLFYELNAWNRDLLGRSIAIQEVQIYQHLSFRVYLKDNASDLCPEGVVFEFRSARRPGLVGFS